MKLTKKQREIEDEIAHYRIKPSVAKVMRELGKLGFEFSGHGMDLMSGEEDFSMYYNGKKNYHHFYIELSKKATIIIEDIGEMVYTTPMNKAVQKTKQVMKAFEIIGRELNKLS